MQFPTDDDDILGPTILLSHGPRKSAGLPNCCIGTLYLVHMYLYNIINLIYIVKNNMCRQTR